MRSRRLALLGVSLLLTLHNAEEALFVGRGLRTVADRIPSIAEMLPEPGEMYVALAVATVVPWLAWLFGAARRETRAGVAILLLLQCIVLVNVAWHAGAAIFLRGYAPGVVTALALNLPFSIYLLRRAWRERWIGRRMLALFVPLAVMLHGPVILGVIWLAGTR